MNKFQQELMGLRLVFDYLVDGNQEAGLALYYVKSNFKRWPEIIKYLKDNKIRGQALADLFKNESDSTGQGYLMGAQFILGRIEKNKRKLTGKDLL